MREKRPSKMQANCGHCGKPFMANKKSIGYTQYCDNCKPLRPWLPSKKFGIIEA